MVASVADLAINVSTNTASVEVGLNKLADIAQKQFGSIEKAIESVGSRFGVLGTAIAGVASGIAAGLSVKIFTDRIKETIDYADHLNDLSQKTGIAVESLGALGVAAKQSGTDLDTIAKAAGKMATKLSEAAGGNQDALQVFQRLGISIRDAKGNIVSMDDALIQAADKFSGYKDGAAKAAAANELFGGKLGADLIPLLNMGGDELKRLREEYEKYGGVTTSVAKQADEFNDTLEKIRLIQGTLYRTIAATLLPTLQAIAEVFLDAKKNGSDFSMVADGINVVLKGLAIGAIGLVEVFKAVGKSFGVLVAALDQVQVFDFKGAWQTLKSGAGDIGDSIATAGSRITKIWSAGADSVTESSNRMARGMDAPVKAAKAVQSEFDKALESFTKQAAEASAGLAEFLSGDKLTGAQKALAGLKASDVWKTFTAGQKQAIEDAAALATAEQKNLDVTQRLSKVMNDLGADATGFATDWAEKFKALSDGFNAGKITLEEYRALTLKLLDQQPFAKKDREELEKLIKLEQQAIDEMGKMQEAATHALGDFADQNTQMEEELHLLGLTEDARARELVLMDAKAKRQLVALYGTKEELDQLDQLIARRQDLVTAQIEIGKAIEAQKDLFRDIANAGANFIEDFVQHGSSAFKNLWNNFKSWALQAFARIASQTLVINVVQAVAPSLTGVAGSALGLTSSGIGQILGGGGGIFSGIGQMIGGQFGAGFSLGIGDAISALSYAADAGVAAIGGLGTAIGAIASVALPVVGIIGAVAAAFGLFGKGGGPKQGGYATGGVDVGTGAATSGISMDRFFTPSDADATVKTIVDSVTKTYADVARSFGLKAGSAAFALGFDTDPKGTAPNRVSAASTVGGQQTYFRRDIDVGRNQEDLQARLSLEAQRALLAALQASDFPKYIADLLNSVDAASATQDQINGIIATAQALKVAVDTVSGLGDQFAAMDPTQIEGLVEAFGGLDQFLSGFQFINANFLTDAQRLATASANLDSAFSDLGLAVPKTHEQFLDLLSSFDLTTEEGRNLYASVSALAPAFVAVNGSAQDAASAVNAAADALDQLRKSGADVYMQNFASTDQKVQADWDKIAAAWNSGLGARVLELTNGAFDHIPTTTAGIQALRTALASVDGGLDLFNEIMGTVGSTIVDLNSTIGDTANASDTATTALDSSSEALGRLAQQAAAAAQAIDQHFSDVFSVINDVASSTPGDQGDKLTKRLQLIGEQITSYQKQYQDLLDSTGGLGMYSPQGKSIQGIIRQLQDAQKAAADDLGRFTVLNAQYGASIAEQLVSLEDTYDTQKQLLKGNSEALAALDSNFHSQWNAIINGTADGVDGTLNQLDKLRQGIKDYLDSLVIGDLSPLTPAQRLQEAARQYQDTLGKAQAGDQDALGNITKAADSYLKSLRDVVASGAPYSEAFGRVQSDLEGLLGAGNDSVAAVDASSTRGIDAALPSGGAKLASGEDIASLRAKIADVQESIAAIADVIEGVSADHLSQQERNARLVPTPA